jgi:nitrogen fixation-related uncharacterized protein
MVQTKYLALLVIATVAAVVIVAVFASGILSKDNDDKDRDGNPIIVIDDDEEIPVVVVDDDEAADVKITLTIDSRVAVTYNGTALVSGVPFYVPESEVRVSLQMKTPSGGKITLQYWSELTPGILTIHSGESEKRATFTANLTRDIHQGNIAGEITFEPF